MGNIPPVSNRNLQSTTSRLSFLDPSESRRVIVPSSSTAALGVAQGNVDRISTITQKHIQKAVTDLHVNDVLAGAGFMVTATCGAHDRQARQDPKAWRHLDNSRDISEQLYELNKIAVQCAYKARDILNDLKIAIFGSVITSGDCYDDSEQLRGNVKTLEQRYRDDHRSQLEAFADISAPVDAVLLEAGGVSSIELMALCQICSEFGLPLLMSLAVRDNGKILDRDWHLSFANIAERARDILGEKFLGLGLNCNSRKSTQAALHRDKNNEVRLVYPNQSNATANERRRGNFGNLATHDQELHFLESITNNHPHICAVGSCCREERNEALLQDFHKSFSRD